MEIYLGIDPGISGAIAAIDQDGNPAGSCSLAGSLEEQNAWLTTTAAQYTITGALVEIVGAKPRDGNRGAFTFGGSYLAAQALLTAAGIRYEKITPTAWQTRLR